MATGNITGFSVGQDLRTLLFIPSNGGGTINANTLGRLMEFNAMPVISELTLTPVNLGGLQLNRNIYHGWTGDISFARYNGNLALLQAAVMGIFQSTGAESYFTIVAGITDSTAGIPVTYSFVNSVIAQVPVGDFRGSGEVSQKLAFRCQQILINGVSPSTLGGLTGPASGGNG